MSVCVNKKKIFFEIFLPVPVGTDMKCTHLDALKYLRQQLLLIDTIKVQGLCQVADFALTKHSFGSCFGFVDFNI